MNNYKVYPDWVADRLGVSVDTVRQYRANKWFDFKVYSLQATGSPSRIKFVKEDEFTLWFEKHLRLDA